LYPSFRVSEKSSLGTSGALSLEAEGYIGSFLGANGGNSVESGVRMVLKGYTHELGGVKKACRSPH